MNFCYVRYVFSEAERVAQLAELHEFIDGPLLVEKVQPKPYPCRHEFHEFINNLTIGDKLVVTSIDRAVQSLRELSVLLEDLGKKGAELKIVTNGRLNPCPSAEVFKPLIQIEQNIRRERHRIGVRKAGKRGAYGSKPSFDYAEAFKLHHEGVSIDELAKRYLVTTRTIYRALSKSGAPAKRDAE
jgi:DNA invertase Pin-like site-specific DNA recombinase